MDHGPLLQLFLVTEVIFLVMCTSSGRMRETTLATTERRTDGVHARTRPLIHGYQLARY